MAEPLVVLLVSVTMMALELALLSVKVAKAPDTILPLVL